MKRALIGKGGHAREVASLMSFPVELFTDEEFLGVDYHSYEVMIAVGDSNTRKSIVSKLPSNVKYFTFIHNTSIVGSDVVVENGSFIGPYCVLPCNIKLGEHTLLLRSNHVGHDSVVGNYLSMMGGSIINGNCNIGDCCYIGANASVREKIKVCSGVTFGMNACVVKNINMPGIYAGVPCYKIK